MEEEHYDVPWEFKKRPFNQRPHSSTAVLPVVDDSLSPTSTNRAGGVFQLHNGEVSIENRVSKSHSSRQSLTASPRLAAHNETSPGEPKPSTHFSSVRLSSNHREGRRLRSSQTSFDRDNLVHDTSVDRAAAENLLRNSENGCFLLRKRPEGNMALSLKSGQGVVLHIKLEERDNRWILGEGPSFSSVRSVIRYYSHSSHTLPIRGAEHIQLRSPVLVNRFPV